MTGVPHASPTATTATLWQLWKSDQEHAAPAAWKLARLLAAPVCAAPESGAGAVDGGRDPVPVDLAPWVAVPELVRERYKLAADHVRRIKRMLKYLPHDDDGGYVFWHPERKAIHAVLSDSADEPTHSRWENALRTLQGVHSVTVAREGHPRDQHEWVMIKQAYGALDKPLQWAGSLTGGASPLTNALVGTMIGGGLGYAGGALAEQLIPERYMRRGRLRKLLGGVGGALGALPGVAQATTNAGLRASPDSPRLGLSAVWTPNESVPLDPDVQALMRHEKGGSYDESAGGSALRPIPLDAFGQVVWNDVRKGIQAGNPYGTKSPWGDNSQEMHTPPQLAAATTGIIGGIREMYHGADVLSPRHFINGLAAAGVDMVTARLVGGTLGALGGLSPETQNRLQDMGLWSGLLRGTVGSMLGRSAF